ncbi:Exonuclease V - a 5' deoxyribonuclease-domain containing protein [Rhodotorula toruloides]|uniref:Exonuclease V-a 5' deoxyribonuclease-domain containing protein n=1 Tax=Rhodotorula toruloides TaxID=5286 RepID=A0A2S9ZZI5_RHOTO|nr:Exonuclease V - a 5' deoxyribonuclease-domain containing protein [Rhodotorula toruloides]
MPGSATDSDFGPELDYDDALEAQLLVLEQNGGDGDRGSRTRQTPLRRVEVEMEDGEGGREHRQSDSAARSYAVELARALADGDTLMQDTPRSLWEQFRRHRKWGALSVSDLAGPTWCEVQHSYRLASKPYLPPSERPATITTASGAEIAVDKTRTVKRENVLIKGRDVHKKIEKEVMGDVKEVQVDVTGKEEWWALRILNTVVGLEALLTTGRVRELPVVGWVNDFLVFGVIDEVERRELPPLPPTPVQTTDDLKAKPKRTPKKGKKAKGTPATPTKKDEQQKLTSFFSPSPSPAKRGGVLDLTDDSPVEESETEQTRPFEPQPRWGFILSDTKTRYKRSIPPPTETRSTRLQLGLYHRLLSSLLQPEAATAAKQAAEPAFSWTRLYTDLALDPTTPLSNGFLDSIAPVIEGSSLEESLGEAETLGDFVAVLSKYADMVRGGRQRVLEDEVEVVYRMRGSSSPARRSAPPPAPASPQSAPPADEDADLQRAIAASLADSLDSQPSELTSRGYASILDILSNDEIDAELRGGMSMSGQEPPVEDSQLEDSQQPFLANPSLPLPVDHLPPSLTDDPSLSAPSSPGPFALPLNSQGRDDADVAPAAASTRSSRYSLRDRSAVAGTAATASEAVQRQGPILDDRPTTSPAVSSSTTTSLASRSQAAADPGLIGVEKIRVDTDELSAWLASITAYWKGEREPVGVRVTEVNRCRFCEFEDGCEWRAAKAIEAMEAAKAKKAARASAA